MRTDRQTDMTKQIVAFRNFANAPKNVTSFETFYQRRDAVDRAKVTTLVTRHENLRHANQDQCCQLYH